MKIVLRHGLAGLSFTEDEQLYDPLRSAAYHIHPLP